MQKTISAPTAREEVTAMPIEFWWWIVPLFMTDVIFVIIAFAVVKVIELFNPASIFIDILAWIALAPLVVCGLSVVVWFVTNVLILIWR